MYFCNCVLLLLLGSEEQQNFRGENHISEVFLVETVRKHSETWSEKKPEEQKVCMDFACVVYFPVTAFLFSVCCRKAHPFKAKKLKGFLDALYEKIHKGRFEWKCNLCKQSCLCSSRGEKKKLLSTQLQE